MGPFSVKTIQDKIVTGKGNDSNENEHEQEFNVH